MSKKKIAILIVAGLGSLFVGAILFAYYDFTHNFRFPLTSEQVADAQIAFKGALGEAIFSGQTSKAVSDVPVAGKGGLDALLAAPPVGNRGKGLIEAYQKDPALFKRYAEMFDTAMNAKQVGDVLLGEASHLPETSESLLMDAKLKVDAWGKPFCLIAVGERVAVISGGPSHLSCNALPLNAEQIANSNRSVYAGPSDVVVVIAMHYSTGGQPAPLKTFLRNYVGVPRSDGTKTTQYFSAFVDLNDDGKQEVIVYLTSDGWCGSGGCTTLILAAEGSSYKVLTKITITRPPIRLLTTKSNGWHDISVWVQGGGIQPGYEAELPFDGKSYPSNPSVPPAQRLVGKVAGQVVVPVTALGGGTPLYQ